MQGFSNRKEFEQWTTDQIQKYGIRQPDTYTDQELRNLNPSISMGFIKRQIAKTKDKVVE